MNTPQQFVIGQLYKLALQQQGYTVSLSRNVGIIKVAQYALTERTLDLYPNYLGVWNSRVAHLHQRFKTLSASYAAARGYAHAHGFVLLKPTPFSDTWGLAVTSEYAQQNHVRSIPELAHGTGIIIAAPLEFETGPDGLPALAKAYHLYPGCVQGIDVGSQYLWLQSGNVQAAWVDTTDARLGRTGFRELQDPKHVFGFGNVVPVTTPRALRREGPMFKQTIDEVDALLTLRAIRGLDYEASVERHNPPISRGSSSRATASCHPPCTRRSPPRPGREAAVLGEADVRAEAAARAEASAAALAAASSSTSTTLGVSTATSTSWAIRSPASSVQVSRRSVFSTRI